MKKKLRLLFGLFFLLNIALAQDTETEKDFYDLSTVRQFNIIFEQQNWPDLLDSMRIHGDGMLIGDVEIEGKTYQNAGVRYRATKGFKPGAKRNSLHIRLNYINKDQSHKGYKTLLLSNALRDPSMVREVLGYEIARKYMPAQQANYAKVAVNGKDYGLFVNIEAVDDQFLTKHFGSPSNTFFKCTPLLDDDKSMPEGCKKNLFASLEYETKASCYTHNFQMLSKEGWDDLIEMTRLLSEDIDALQDVLNIDRTLWMLAFNNVLVNLNSYTGANSQHYYLYKDNNGQFNPIITDLNFAFGSLKSIGSGSDIDPKDLYRLDPLLHADNPTKPLIHKLLANELIKKIYLNHIRTIVFDYFESGRYEELANQFQALIRPYFEQDPNREYNMEEFDTSLTTTIGERSKIPGIVELMSKRSKFLKKHSGISVIPPEVESVVVTKRAKFSNEIIKDFNIVANAENRAKRLVVYYRFEPSQKFEKAFMKDDGTQNDGTADDDIFGVTIVPKNGETTIEYFILSENAAAASFTPADYMYKPFMANLEELNR